MYNFSKTLKMLGIGEIVITVGFFWINVKHEYFAKCQDRFHLLNVYQTNDLADIFNVKLPMLSGPVAFSGFLPLNIIIIYKLPPYQLF